MEANILQHIECVVCHQFKQLDQFVKDRNKKEGIRHICRICQKRRYKEYRKKWAIERSRGQIEIPNEKECKKCNQVKPVAEFSKCYSRKDGILNICKNCKSKYRVMLISKWQKERCLKKTTVKVKICNKCLRFLPVSHFNKSINYKIGLDGVCKKCQIDLTQEYKTRWAEERKNSSFSIDKKSCTSCNRVLPISSFYHKEYSKDGFHCYCIECDLAKAEINAVKWHEERLKTNLLPKEKSCNICKRLLPISQFHKSRRYRDGLWATCINCVKTRQEGYNQEWEESRSNNDEILVAKECNACYEILPVSSFSRNKRHKDGLVGTCKKCMENRHQGYMAKWKREQPDNIIDFTRMDDLFPSFEKECASCHKTLPVTFFCHNVRKKDGFASLCKDCAKKMGKESRERVKKIAKRIIPPEKSCRKCNIPKPSAEFYKDIHSSDGLSTYCKQCESKREKEYRNRPEVKKKTRERKRLYDSRPDVVKRKREYSRRYIQRPEVKKRRKKYNEEYRKRPEVRERLLHYDREYRKRKKIVKNLLKNT
jgi:hypothetical protein